VRVYCEDVVCDVLAAPSALLVLLSVVVLSVLVVLFICAIISWILCVLYSRDRSPMTVWIRAIDCRT
jgi:hypothetical protein